MTGVGGPLLGGIERYRLSSDLSRTRYDGHKIKKIKNHKKLDETNLQDTTHFTEGSVTRCTEFKEKKYSLVQV